VIAKRVGLSWKLHNWATPVAFETAVNAIRVGDCPTRLSQAAVGPTACASAERDLSPAAMCAAQVVAPAREALGAAQIVADQRPPLW